MAIELKDALGIPDGDSLIRAQRSGANVTFGGADNVALRREIAQAFGPGVPKLDAADGVSEPILDVQFANFGDAVHRTAQRFGYGREMMEAIVPAAATPVRGVFSFPWAHPVSAPSAKTAYVIEADTHLLIRLDAPPGGLNPPATTFRALFRNIGAVNRTIYAGQDATGFYPVRLAPEHSTLPVVAPGETVLIEVDTAIAPATGFAVLTVRRSIKTNLRKAPWVRSARSDHGTNNACAIAAQAGDLIMLLEGRTVTNAPALRTTPNFVDRGTLTNATLFWFRIQTYFATAPEIVGGQFTVEAPGGAVARPIVLAIADVDPADPFVLLPVLSGPKTGTIDMTIAAQAAAEPALWLAGYTSVQSGVWPDPAGIDVLHSSYSNPSSVHRIGKLDPCFAFPQMTYSRPATSNVTYDYVMGLRGAPL